MTTQTFDFFGLSRELRDLVYEHALVPEKWKRFNRGIRTRVERFTSTNLLLVSRQFREEYTATSRRCTSLTVVDVASKIQDLDHTAFDFETMPVSLRRVRSIDFRLWLAPKASDETQAARVEWRSHTMWLRDFLCCVRPSQGVSLVF